MTRPSGYRLRRGAALLCLGLLAWGAGAAQAQQRYELKDGQWQKQPAPSPESPEGRLLAIRKAVAEERPAEAQELADVWIEQYPNHPLLPEAYVLRGDALSYQRDYYNALFDYEFVARQYPGSEQFLVAVEREYQIARLYSNGIKRQFLWFFWLPAYSEAEELLLRVQERAPGGELGEKASLELGEHYMRQGEMLNAATAFDLFLTNYPASLRRQQAMRRLIDANLAGFQGPRFDAKGLLEAQQRLRLFQTEFPAAAEQMGADAVLVRIDESLARKDYLTAQWYQTRGEKVSAVQMYRRVARDYPRTAAARDALQRLTDLGAPAAPAPPTRRVPRSPERQVVPLPATQPAPGAAATSPATPPRSPP